MQSAEEAATRAMERGDVERLLPTTSSRHKRRGWTNGRSLPAVPHTHVWVERVGVAESKAARDWAIMRLKS